ncbi:hypothetical protein DRN98_06360 [Methanosarcinales archaeon]|nr:MAG: hypothetical protein DRN98_06360 [Methanosarcinales archaeon]
MATAGQIVHHTNEFQTYTSGAAITKGNLVALNNAGRVITATASTNNVIGVARETVTAAGQELLVASGYLEVYLVAGGAVTAGAILEAVDNGRVDDTTAGACQKIGVAMEAASSAGDVIKCIVNLPRFGA